MKSISHITMAACTAVIMFVSTAGVKAQVIPADDNHFLVHFSIAWENSWRGEISDAEDALTVTGPGGTSIGHEGAHTGLEGWDAAWLFVKYRTGAEPWKHALLNDEGHLVPEGVSLVPGLLNPEQAYHPENNPVVGYFLYRDDNGFGRFSADGVKLSLDYARNGLSADMPLEVRLFAVEMEYIPAWESASAAPFYMMKEQVTEQQFVDFLNTLSAEDQMRHTTASPFSSGGTAAMDAGSQGCSGIRIIFPAYEMNGKQFPAEYMTENPGGSCDFLSRESIQAFLGWSGQRNLNRQEVEMAENWIVFRNEKYRRLNQDNTILGGSIGNDGLAAGYRGARSAVPAHGGSLNPITRAQLTPPKR